MTQLRLDLDDRLQFLKQSIEESIEDLPSYGSLIIMKNHHTNLEFNVTLRVGGYDTEYFYIVGVSREEAIYLVDTYPEVEVGFQDTFREIYENHKKLKKSK